MEHRRKVWRRLGVDAGATFLPRVRRMIVRQVCAIRRSLVRPRWQRYRRWLVFVLVGQSEIDHFASQLRRPWIMRHRRVRNAIQGSAIRGGKLPLNETLVFILRITQNDNLRRPALPLVLGWWRTSHWRRLRRRSRFSDDRVSRLPRCRSKLIIRSMPFPIRFHDHVFDALWRRSQDFIEITGIWSIARLDSNEQRTHPSMMRSLGSNDRSQVGHR